LGDHINERHDALKVDPVRLAAWVVALAVADLVLVAKRDVE